MGLNTFPCNPYPISTEELNKGNNDALNTRVTALEGDVSDLEEQKANQITIALSFNPETEYEVGDLVYYNGLTYRCTNAHTGEWDADDFAGTTIANELSTLMSGLTNLSSAFHEVAINETFVFGPQMGFVAWLGWGGKQIKGYIPIPNDAIFRGTYQAQIQSNENLTVSVNGAVTNLDKTKISSIEVNPRNGAVIIVFSEAPVNNVDNTIVNVVTSFELTRTA